MGIKAKYVKRANMWVVTQTAETKDKLGKPKTITKQEWYQSEKEARNAVKSSNQ